MGKLIVIAGPTASGKTKLAIDLARRLKAEIVSADSRQFFKQMDIGTAKPTRDEMAAIKHHFIDIKLPNEYYSAGEFESDALKFLEQYFESNQYAILVGGSGLYIKAIMEGFDDLPKDPVVREKLNAKLETHGIAELQAQLKSLDPLSYQSVDLFNPHRVIRALEVIEISGRPYSEQLGSNRKKRNFDVEAFCLSPDRQVLYNRINARVDEMIASGLVKEVESLQSFRAFNAMKTVGYQEIMDFMDGKTTLERAIELIKQHSRNYAKRQTTWFRKQANFQFLDADYEQNIMKHLNIK